MSERNISPTLDVCDEVSSTDKIVVEKLIEKSIRKGEQNRGRLSVNS